jgi:hypothetical protein
MANKPVLSKNHKENLVLCRLFNAGKQNARRAIKSFDQTFSKVWPPAGPPEAAPLNNNELEEVTDGRC